MELFRGFLDHKSNFELPDFIKNLPALGPWLDDYVLDMFARLTEDYEEDKHLIPKGHLVELRYEDFVKDPVAAMRDIYRRLDIPNFEAAEAPMREFLAERSEHKVSRYEMPDDLKRKVIDRLKPYIDRFGYRAAVDASLAGTPAKPPVRRTAPSSSEQTPG